MYIPFVITILYFYTAVKKLNNTRGPTYEELYIIVRNLLVTEILFWYTDWYAFSDIFTNAFSIINLVMFFISQDIYFYGIHKILHFKYIFQTVHYIHHGHYATYNAWYAHILDHILLNLLSIGVPFAVFPNTRWVFMLIAFLEVYTSVNGHSKNSKHYNHHINHKHRLGSIYIIDRLMGSY